MVDTNHVNFSGERLRAAVTQRAVEKNISLEKALLEITAEGTLAVRGMDDATRMRVQYVERVSSVGAYCRQLAEAVAEKFSKMVLSPLYRDLPPHKIFQLAADAIVRERPSLLVDYRRDVTTVKLTEDVRSDYL